MDKLYVVSYDVQKKSVEKYCFGECGEIVLGAIEADGRIFLPCRREDCPHLDAQMNEPIFEFDGDGYCLRKLSEE